MIVTKAWLATAIAVAGLGLASCNAVPAHADPLCERRGMEHIERHGGKLEDDAYHRSHGERVTCDKDDQHGDFAPYERHEADRHADTDNRRRDDDTPLPGHRDKPGYGCWMLRCG